MLSKLSDMTYYTESLLQENRKYKKFIEDFQLGVNLFKDNSTSQFTSSMKEIISNSKLDKNQLNKSLWEKKKQICQIEKSHFLIKKIVLKK